MAERGPNDTSFFLEAVVTCTKPGAGARETLERLRIQETVRRVQTRTDIFADGWNNARDCSCMREFLSPSSTAGLWGAGGCMWVHEGT